MKTLIRVLVFFFAIFCTSVFISASAGASEEEQKTYNQNLVKTLERQKEFGNPQLAHKSLDRIFEKLDKAIKSKTAYTKREAVRILKRIDAVLKNEENFSFSQNSLLIEELIKDSSQKKYLDCDDYSSIYLAEAERIGLTLKPIYFPSHVFLKCELKNMRIFFWDPTTAEETQLKDFRFYQNYPEWRSYPKLLDEVQFDAIKLCDLGTAWLNRKDILRAINYFQQALDANPEFSPIQNNLGAAYAKQENYGQALVHYSRAVALDPNYYEAICNMGVACYKMGKLDQAIKCFERALTLSPKNEKLRWYTFKTLLENGEIEKANRFLAPFNRK
jgi:tetratricopeptide (TPR) repeat protein